MPEQMSAFAVYSKQASKKLKKLKKKTPEQNNPEKKKRKISKPISSRTKTASKNDAGRVNVSKYTIPNEIVKTNCFASKKSNSGFTEPQKAAESAFKSTRKKRRSSISFDIIESSDSEIPELVEPQLLPKSKSKRRKKLKASVATDVSDSKIVKIDDNTVINLDSELLGSGNTVGNLNSKLVSDLSSSKYKIEEDPPLLSESLLNFLLAPVKSGEFFENYWEKSPLHISRQKSEYFKNILNSQKLDKILRENPLYYTRNVDVVTYENGERQTHNPEGRAVPTSVWDYYSNGCSVRILNPQTYCQKIRLLLTTLQEYFGTMVGANVYLTPHGSQGFAPHYDDIEAFVLQLEGRKHWKLYAPRSESEVLPRYSSPNFSRDELGDPIKELTVEAGDLLYFPRGFIHEACTDDEAHSLHITVSVYQNTAYVDLLEKLLPEALRLAARDDVDYRRGLPLHYLKELGAVNSESTSPIRNEILANVQRLITKLAEHAPVDLAADQMGRKFMYDALPPVLSHSEKDCTSKCDGEFLIDGTVRNRVEFDLDTMVRLVRYYSLRLVIENESMTRLYYCTENALFYHGEEEQSLDVDVSLLEVIRMLMQQYPNYVSIEDLPCQDETEKVNAISHLWERGLIVTQEKLEICDD